MIGVIDTIVLAYTKLQSKRLMLVIAVTVSGLLFGILYGATIITDGASKSASDYTRTALDGKYLVKSTPVLPADIFGPARVDLSKQLIEELKSMQTDYTARQKVVAKQLSIPYDEKNVEQILVPDSFANTNLPVDMRVMINSKAPVFQEYVQKLQTDYVKVAKNKLSDLKQVAAPYGAVTYHQNEQAVVNYADMAYLKNGKEDLAKIGQDVSPSNSDLSIYGYLTSSVRNSMYSFVDDSLVSRFILPENVKRQANTTAIPIVITAKEATDVFSKQYNIPEKPTNASDQITWMKNLQQKVNGTTYTACYRNQTETAQIAQITQTAAEIVKNKDNKDYIKPALIYNPPTETCGGVTIKSDSRTTAEKKTAQQQDDLSKKLGTYTAPDHHLFTFQVVGIMSVSPQEDALKSLPAFMSELLGAQYGEGAIIPRQMYSKLPDAVRREDILQNMTLSGLDMSALKNASIGEAIVEFQSLDSARSFMKEQGCPTQDGCKRQFALEPYGSNYLLMDDLNATVLKAIQIALPIAVGVAGIIIWATMARVIIDSRRETAVFRAIGAKRSDIASIYLFYSLNVALRIVFFSVLLGISIAAFVQALYSGQVTDNAKVAYGVFDKGQTFNFIGFGSPLLGWLTLCIVGISLVAVLPPLMRNIRRNPINDMRDD